jgi:hypothetical protein
LRRADPPSKESKIKKLHKGQRAKGLQIHRQRELNYWITYVVILDSRNSVLSLDTLVHDLFNDAVSSSDYIASNGRIINK